MKIKKLVCLGILCFTICSADLHLSGNVSVNAYAEESAEAQTETNTLIGTGISLTEISQTEIPASELQTETAAAESSVNESLTEAAATETPVTEVQTEAAVVETPATEAQTEISMTEVQTTEAQIETSVTEAVATEIPGTELLSETVATENQLETAESMSAEAGAGSDTEQQTNQSDESKDNSEESKGDTLVGDQVSTESELVTDMCAESEVTSETLPETGTELETDTEEGALKGANGSSEEREEKELEGKNSSQYSSNSELIAAQNIVNARTYSREYRFTQIEKVYATTLTEGGVMIYESKSDDSSEIGILGCQSVCFIIEDSGDGWYYVESGNVRGFVKSEGIITGEEALRYVNDSSETAVGSVPYYENSAFTYTLTTVYAVIADKVYALTGNNTSIYEREDTSSSVVGKLGVCGLCYVLADGDEWMFVESGEARGFVQKSSLIMGSVAKNKIESIGESGFQLADVLISPEDNDACYYTLTSVEAASQSAALREQIVGYALQFLGNPYVWGGTSLTSGADCSGFVQSIYAHFGYSLPRVAASQSTCSTQIPVSQASPGDLIFFAESGYVYHVGMYIGNGQIVHASSTKSRIIISSIWNDAVWAVQIIH